MKVLVVHSGHLMSTIDVTTGLIAGLRANGVRVAEYRLHEPLDLAHRLVLYAKEAGEDLPTQLPYDMAAGGIPGAALLVGADAVIVVTGRNVPWAVPQALSRGGVTTVLLCTESPYTTHALERHDAAAYDYVFTNERSAVPLFDRNAPARVHYLPHAYNPDIHTPGEPEEAFLTDVLFVGTGFEERRALFGGVDWRGVRHTLLGPLWDGATDGATIVSHAVPNTETARRYRSAAICLNHHRTTADWTTSTQIADGAESLGPRAYEIAACNGFQLSDDSRVEAREVFGDTLPTYKAGDSADLSRQIRFWLSRPHERARLAAAQREAVRPHTWAARAAHLLSIVAVRPRVIRLASSGDLMATKHGINSVIYMGPASGNAIPIAETTEININIDTDFADDSAQGDSWSTSLPGLSTFELSFTKHFDSGTGSLTLLKAVRDRTEQKFYAYPDRSDATIYVYGQGYLGGGGLGMGMGDVIDQEFSLEPTTQPTIVAP